MKSMNDGHADGGGAHRVELKVKRCQVRSTSESLEKGDRRQAAGLTRVLSAIHDSYPKMAISHDSQQMERGKPFLGIDKTSVWGRFFKTVSRIRKECRVACNWGQQWSFKP